MAMGKVQMLHISPYGSLEDYCAGRAPVLCGIPFNKIGTMAYVWAGDLIVDPVDPATEVMCPKCLAHPDYALLFLAVA